MLQGDFTKAIELFTKCIELFPDRVVPYTNRALCYLRINEVLLLYILPVSIIACKQCVNVHELSYKWIYVN